MKRVIFFILSILFICSFYSCDVRLSNDAPTLKLISPSDGDTVSGTTVEFDFEHSDDYDSKLQIRVYFVEEEKYVDWVVASREKIEVNTTLLANGEHTVQAAAFDSEGARSNVIEIKLTVSN